MGYGEQKEPVRVPLGDGEEIVFRHVPAGSFRMGERGRQAREEPVTKVFLEEFWIGETPVTRGQYRAIANAVNDLEIVEDSFGSTEVKDGDDRRRPMGNVIWEEAREVGRLLTREMVRSKKLPSGMYFDLPTEAQWEKACRAGTSTDYYNGDGEAALAEVGLYDGGIQKSKPLPVKSTPANLWGLSDCHGSVWQWCLDSYNLKEPSSIGRLLLPKHFGCTRVPNHSDKVLRGGSWDLDASWCRSAFRHGYPPDGRFGHFGFRLALVPFLSKKGEKTAAREIGQAIGGDEGDSWDDLRGPKVSREGKPN